MTSTANPAAPKADAVGPNGSGASALRARVAVGGLVDEELARRSADGDRACFAELVVRYSDRVFGLILSRVRVRADAEEASQETFLKAWRGIKTFDPERRFSAWVMTIAHRQAIEVIRTRKRDRNRLAMTREQQLSMGAKGNDNHSEPETTGADEISVWSTARQELKPDAYEALWLRYAENCSPQEVAQVMGKTSVWVRVSLHRSRSRLAEIMGEQTQAKPHERNRGEDSIQGAHE